MNPSIEDRIASVVRAMTEIILPALPATAGLAREQLQLSIGHLQILQAQIGMSAAFEDEQLSDARGLAKDLLAQGSGGAATSAALAALSNALPSASSAAGINQSIDELIRAASNDGADIFRASLTKIVIRHEEVRSSKDRHWFKPMGFDQDVSA